MGNRQAKFAVTDKFTLKRKLEPMDKIDWEEVGREAIGNLLKDWINPEVERRLETGMVESPFNLRAAQIIFYPDSRPIEFRLNSEVKATARMNLLPGVEKQAGDAVFEHELERFENVQLPENDDPNCAHITLFLLNSMWHLHFDFRYNKALARKHIEVARQFYHLADYAFIEKLWRPFVDTLFSAAELAAKSQLLLMPDPRILKSKQHKYLQSQYNRFANLGNVPPTHQNTFNKLSQMRPLARYVDKNFTLSESEAHEYLRNVKRMIEEAQNRST